MSLRNGWMDGCQPATRLGLLGEHLARSIETSIVPRTQWEELFERVMKPSLAELLIKANDAQNPGGLVDIGPDSNEVCFGTTTLFDALGQSLMSL
ncbi:hypothetical protein BFJ68_g9699 [Fusarium oxysporum]|uniref:Uncharacterized protein n=1 Tax=Fusarium oxysporum TaxID=5507 RepID=A0A420P686_FUSOX|nr:hypothetical protein BFJ71_g13139 [Fusarium oxysporum]RKL07900.1 hypothetical protein BFJ68_g9699 [Fusarium oxysporum]